MQMDFPIIRYFNVYLMGVNRVMARFILDVANLKNWVEIKQVMDNICDENLGLNNCMSMTCIDTTNTAQSHDKTQYNALTKKQIRKFNTCPHG